MLSKRHEILGKEPHVPLAETLEVLGEYDAEYEPRVTINPPPGGQQYVREQYLGLVIHYVVLEHLGFGPIDHLKARIDRGVNEALDYFLRTGGGPTRTMFWPSTNRERDASSSGMMLSNRPCCWEAGPGAGTIS